MATAQNQAKSLSVVDVRLARLRQILIEEARNGAIKNPMSDLPTNHYDEVFENCFLGDFNTALDRSELRKLGITHVLNAAKGPKFSQVDTNQNYYSDSHIKFYGCNLMDVDGCKIEKYFPDATYFIHEALDVSKGKILVHCYQGISRSATFVLAYLIIYREYTLEDALRMLMKKRLVWPNNGFLGQLIMLESDCKQKRKQENEDGLSSIN